MGTAHLMKLRDYETGEIGGQAVNGQDSQAPPISRDSRDSRLDYLPVFSSQSLTSFRSSLYRILQIPSQYCKLVMTS